MGTITVTNLGKAYKQYPTRWARLAEWLSPFAAPRHQLHWVLRDLNFRIESGEAVGIIGMNGAGKSTLLKMITGTTQPTAGKIEIGGRMAALLELGMGFHPDFTGRQNVFMAGQLLGYSADDIANLMPEIEAFAEIGEYIDQPVRVYSSGMQMRLAFSVATATRPDILIVDEALSVGDAYFQHKSFRRIREFREKGTTLLLVSHDKQAVQSLCDRALLLEAGRIVMDAKPDLVMDYYNAKVIQRRDSAISFVKTDDEVKVVSGNGRAVVKSAKFFDKDGREIDTVNVGQDLACVITVLLKHDVKRLVLGYQIKDRVGQPVFGTNTQYMDRVLHDCKRGDVYKFTFRFPASLGPGSYSLATALVDTDGVALFENYEWNEMSAMVHVVNASVPHFVGCAWIPPAIEIRKV